MVRVGKGILDAEEMYLYDEHVMIMMHLRIDLQEFRYYMYGRELHGVDYKS